MKSNLHYKEYRQGKGALTLMAMRDRMLFAIKISSLKNLNHCNNAWKTYTVGDMDIVISPDPDDGQDRVILVTQDECFFKRTMERKNFGKRKREIKSK